MIFFKKKGKDDILWKDLIKIVDLINIKISKLETEVELINGKLRKRVYKGNDSSIQDDDSPNGRTNKETSDGFDSLREIARNINSEKLGL